MNHGNTGNQNAVKADKKDATIIARVKQSSKEKAKRDAIRLDKSVSQHIEDLING